MSALDDAEKAYEIACDYHDRGDLKSMVKWMTLYEELCRDARTNLKATEDQQVRLVAGDLRGRVVPLSSARGFTQVRKRFG